MPNTCWAPGCKTGYASVDSTGRHLFKVPDDAERIKVWQRHIPRVGQLSSKHYICDLHFKEQFLLKTYSSVNIAD